MRRARGRARGDAARRRRRGNGRLPRLSRGCARPAGRLRLRVTGARRFRPYRRARQRRGRRRGADHAAGRRGDGRGVARDLRHQSGRRLPLYARGGASHEARAARRHREHLLGRRPLVQPDRHPGLRRRQGRAHRPDATDGARARRARDSREQRGPGLHPLESRERAPVGGHGRRRPAAAAGLDRAGPPRAARGPRRSRGRSSSSCQTTPPTSPARPSAWTAGTGCSAEPRSTQHSARLRLRLEPRVT